MVEYYNKDRSAGSQRFSNEQIDVFYMLWGGSLDPKCIKDEKGQFIFANDAYLSILDVPHNVSLIGVSEEYLISLFQSSTVIDIISGSRAVLSDLSSSEVSFVLKVSNPHKCNVDYFYFDKCPVFDLHGGVCGFSLNGRKKFILSLSMFSKGKCASEIKTIAPNSEITGREWEVVYFLQQHYTSTEIADILMLSPKTVKNHIHHLYRKTDIQGYSQFIAFCTKWDLLHYIPPAFQSHTHL